MLEGLFDYQKIKTIHKGVDLVLKENNLTLC